MPARSSHRSSPAIPAVEALDLARNSPLSEELAALTRAELILKRAQAREVEAATAREDRKAEAEIGLIEAQRQKVAGEVAGQPKEAEERQLRIENSEAELLRSWLWILLPAILIAVPLILGSIDAVNMDGSWLSHCWRLMLQR